MTLPAADFYRLDPLTGSNNFLSFVESLAQHLTTEVKQPFSILYLDMNHLQMLNDTRGHAYGDSAIRWLGIVLQEECNAPTYRIGGDDFAVVLTDGIHADYEELLGRIFMRLNKEGEQLGIPSPAARIALIHYEADHDFSMNDVMFHLSESIMDVKRNRDRTIKIYKARNLIRSTAAAADQDIETIRHSWDVVMHIANQAVHKVLQMGKSLDVAQKNSYIDSISGLPNMLAAMMKLDKEIASRQPFAFLLMDGDNLRLFNSINYAAGDEAIQNMGRVLSEQLRPGDFLARWRAGDEFVAILPNTSMQGAKVVGERFCTAIREASKDWLFPTSISIGIAVYPQHGNHLNELTDAAEAANKQAKDEGKDRVVLARPVVLPTTASLA